MGDISPPLPRGDQRRCRALQTCLLARTCLQCTGLLLACLLACSWLAGWLAGWLAYLPPSRAAGAASVMCGYNSLNGSVACGGDRRLVHVHLRRKMGFSGFMMTDWWGLHNAQAAHNGVDQEQPGK